MDHQLVSEIREVKILLQKILKTMEDGNSNDLDESLFVTVATASKILKRTPRTIREWCSSGKLKAKKVGRGSQQDRIYIARNSIHRLLRMKGEL